MDVSLADKIALKFAFNIPEAMQLSGVCRSNLYLAISNGELRAKKLGTRTLIAPDDLRAWIDSLPSWTPSVPNCARKASGAGKAEKPPAVKKRVLRPREAVAAAPRRRRLVAAE
jgi:predicted DNA-binding transcriptional regulator AlpA